MLLACLPDRQVKRLAHSVFDHQAQTFSQLKIKKKLIENDKARFNAILFIVIIFYSLFLIRFTNKNNLKLPFLRSFKFKYFCR